MQYRAVNDPVSLRVPYGLVVDEGVPTIIKGLYVDDVDSTGINAKASARSSRAFACALRSVLGAFLPLLCPHRLLFRFSATVWQTGCSETDPVSSRVRAMRSSRVRGSLCSLPLAAPLSSMLFWPLVRLALPASTFASCFVATR